MPYKSRAQAAYMHIHHPEIANRWDNEYPHKKKLPKHIKKSDTMSDLNETAGLGAGGILGSLGGLAGGHAGYDALMQPKFDQAQVLIKKVMNSPRPGGMARLGAITRALARMARSRNVVGLGGALGLGAVGARGGLELGRMINKQGEDMSGSLGGLGDGGQTGIGIPTTGPMSANVQGPQMASSLGDLGGPMLGKTAAAQFERMNKSAQAQILTDKSVPALVKLALALKHTPRLNKQAKIKLAKHILDGLPQHEKQAVLGAMASMAKRVVPMMGKTLGNVRGGIGNMGSKLMGAIRGSAPSNAASAGGSALQKVIASAGGNGAVLKNLGHVEDAARAGQGFISMGKAMPETSTMLTGADKWQQGLGNMAKGTQAAGQPTAQAATNSWQRGMENLGKQTAQMGGQAPAAAPAATANRGFGPRDPDLIPFDYDPDLIPFD